MCSYLILSLPLLAGALLLTAPLASAAASDSATLCKSLKASAARVAKVKGKKKAAQTAKGLRLLAVHIEKIAAGELDVNHRSKEGLSALMVATALGHKAAMEWLIEQGADPALKDGKGKDSFERLRKDNLREILEAGRQPADAELIELTANPSMLPHPPKVQELLQKGVSPYARNQALKACFINWKGDFHNEIIKLLLEQGAKVNALLVPGHMAEVPPGKSYETFEYQPLYMFISNLYDSGSLNIGYSQAYARELYTLLLQHGLKPKQIANTIVDEESGLTQLMKAAASNHSFNHRSAECVAWLLANGADPDVRNKVGKTALDLLADAKSDYFAVDIPVKKALLGADEELAVLNSALEAAVRAGAVECAEKLLVKGADIRTVVRHRQYGNVQEVFNASTPFSFDGTSDVLGAKRESAYFYYATNHPLYPMLRDFSSDGSRRMRELLVNAAGDHLAELLNSTCGQESKINLLMAAAEVTADLDATCPPEAVAWLLEHGADPHAKNEQGMTAYDMSPNEAKKKLLKAAMEKAGK